MGIGSFLFISLKLLLSIWDKKIIDYNICERNVIKSTNNIHTNNIRSTNLINITNIYNSIILCKNIDFPLLKSIDQKNIIYTYEETIPSQYSYNFLLILLAHEYDYPIVTGKYNYFKPFQYNTNDISLFKIKELETNSFAFTKSIITKNSKQFFIEGSHSNLFIKI